MGSTPTRPTVILVPDLHPTNHNDQNEGVVTVQIFLFLALIIAIIAVIFAVQNTAMVTLAFLAWKVDQPLAVVLLVTLAAGAVDQLFLLTARQRPACWGLRQQKKKITELDAAAQLQDARGKLTELDTRLQEKDIQLVKLQDELVALKTPPQPEPAVAPPRNRYRLPRRHQAQASPAKSDCVFFQTIFAEQAGLDRRA